MACRDLDAPAGPGQSPDRVAAQKARAAEDRHQIHDHCHASLGMGGYLWISRQTCAGWHGQPVDDHKALAGEDLGDGKPSAGGRGGGHGPQFRRSGARLDRIFLAAKAGDCPILTWGTTVPKDRRPTAGPAGPARAQMAELVDALVSGTSAARRGGSSPLLGTRKNITKSISYVRRLESQRRKTGCCSPDKSVGWRIFGEEFESAIGTRTACLNGVKKLSQGQRFEQRAPRSRKRDSNFSSDRPAI